MSFRAVVSDLIGKKEITKIYLIHILLQIHEEKGKQKTSTATCILAPHCQWETDLESSYCMVKGLNIDYCIQGDRMLFSLVSGFQRAAVLHKHLGVPNTKKTYDGVK